MEVAARPDAMERNLDSFVCFGRLLTKWTSVSVVRSLKNELWRLGNVRDLNICRLSWVGHIFWDPAQLWIPLVQNCRGITIGTTWIDSILTAKLRLILKLLIEVKILERMKETMGLKRVVCYIRMLKFRVFTHTQWLDDMEIAEEPVHRLWKYIFIHLHSGADMRRECNGTQRES